MNLRPWMSTVVLWRRMLLCGLSCGWIFPGIVSVLLPQEAAPSLWYLLESPGAPSFSKRGSCFAWIWTTTPLWSHSPFCSILIIVWNPTAFPERVRFSSTYIFLRLYLLKFSTYIYLVPSACKVLKLYNLNKASWTCQLVCYKQFY